jgi:3-hydroxyisobutyrate dehydrogenase-like beta-hydroxyacid dehydrogenase
MNTGQASRVALLGTGKMGSAIARRLDEGGYGLTVWNRTRARAESLGVGRIAASPADAVHDAEIVISSLTGRDALNATYFGAEGAIAGAISQLFIDMSTAGPVAEIELGSAVRAAGASFLEAPILGSPGVVDAG